MFSLEELKGKDYSEDVGVVGEDNIKMDLREIGRKFVEWTHLALDMYQWRAVLNTVMKFRVS
jgi:hypothetical protein